MNSCGELSERFPVRHTLLFKSIRSKGFEGGIRHSVSARCETTRPSERSRWNNLIRRPRITLMTENRSLGLRSLAPAPWRRE